MATPTRGRVGRGSAFRLRCGPIVFFALVLLLAFALRLHASHGLRIGASLGFAAAGGRERPLLARVEALVAAADLERSAHGVAASELEALHAALERGAAKLATRRPERTAPNRSDAAATLVVASAAPPSSPRAPPSRRRRAPQRARARSSWRTAKTASGGS